VPDFSWGWAAVAGGYWKVAGTAANRQLADAARASGREAADRAIAIDSKNSEALYIKAMLLDRHDWVGRDSLLKRAVAARRLDCGCEYHQYGWMLVNVGRVAEGIEQLRQANDMLALYVYTPLSLADALVAAGKAEESKTYFDAAIALAPNAEFAAGLAASKAAETGDINALADPNSPMFPEKRAALLKGYRAVPSTDASAKAEAVRSLLALPSVEQDAAVAKLLADLGANRDALRIAASLSGRYFPGPSIFWDPRMRSALNDAEFPALATELGLMNYWKATKTRPDVCKGADPPPFCRMI
jgi:tetratricopeptide (TPR) repeat protein